MRVYLAVFLCTVLCNTSLAQLSDSFSDNNLKLDPTWFFKPNTYENSNGKLHSISTVLQDTLLIATPHNAVNNQIFTIDIELNANPSGNNYIDIYLGCDSLTSEVKNGYFIRFGNTKDDISFYKTENYIQQELISGIEGELNKSNNTYRIQLYQYPGHIWQLSYTNLSNGNQVWLGKSSDSTFSSLKYMGLRIVQSGISIQKKHWIDNIYSGKIIVDKSPPTMAKVQVLFPDTLAITFNEKIIPPRTTDFELSEIGSPISATLENPFRVVLKFQQTFLINHSYSIKNLGTKDTSGNESYLHRLQFITSKGETPAIGEIIFTEIMADPEPTVGLLPEEEFVEIKNTGPRYLTLKNLAFSDGSTNVILPDSIIKPFEYAVLLKNSNANWPIKDEKIIRLNSFPVLNNDADYIFIENKQNEKIAQVKYNQKWHTNELKKTGGWSLELVDTQFTCISIGNWSSNVSHGGSPGLLNSVSQKLTAINPFQVISVIAMDDKTLQLTFNAMPDSAQCNTLQFKITPDDNYPDSIFGFNYADNSLKLHFTKNFAPHKIYTLISESVPACYGELSASKSSTFGLGKKTIFPNQLLLNEVLFDPKENDPDYVEIYNNTDSIINLDGMLLCNLNNNQPENIVSIPYTGRTIFPREYWVLTTSPEFIIKRYPSNNPNHFIELIDLPSMPNSSGSIALLSRSGLVIDQFEYSEKMHSPVIVSGDGISLEKTNPALSSSDKYAWTSAAASSQFGTPGLRNSQYIASSTQIQFQLKQAWFSPDNDGFNDLLVLEYETAQAGQIVNAMVFHENGTKVHELYSNHVIGSSGILSWDGKTENGPLAPGNYLLFLETYNPNGGRLQKKFVFSVLN